jgi:hypothetical protein
LRSLAENSQNGARLVAGLASRKGYVLWNNC